MVEVPANIEILKDDEGNLVLDVEFREELEDQHMMDPLDDIVPHPTTTTKLAPLSKPPVDVINRHQVGDDGCCIIF